MGDEQDAPEPQRRPLPGSPSGPVFLAADLHGVNAEVLRDTVSQSPQRHFMSIGRRSVLMFVVGRVVGGHTLCGEDNAKASRTGLDACGRRAGLPGRGRRSNWFHHGRN